MDRCEYCRLPESVSFAVHQLDHIIAEKHGGQTVQENLAYCCTLCNRRKGSDLSSVDPQTGRVVILYHPRRHRWARHFRLEGLRIEPLTAIGRATVRLLALNSEARLAEREALAAQHKGD